MWVEARGRHYMSCYTTLYLMLEAESHTGPGARLVDTKFSMTLSLPSTVLVAQAHMTRNVLEFELMSSYLHSKCSCHLSHLFTLYQMFSI